MNSLNWSDLIPLRQKNVDEYDPSLQQIIDYAEFIGLELPADQHLLYLAREGITASLPDQWQACQTSTGEMVYRNLITKQIQEEHPLDLIYRKKVFQIKHQSLVSDLIQQSDFTRKTQLLPAIEQEKGQFSESSLSDYFQPLEKRNLCENHSSESAKRNKKLNLREIKSKLPQNNKESKNAKNAEQSFQNQRKENKLSHSLLKKYNSNQIIHNPNYQELSLVSKKEQEEMILLYNKNRKAQKPLEIYQCQNNQYQKELQKYQILLNQKIQAKQGTISQKQVFNEFIGLDDERGKQNSRNQIRNQVSEPSQKLITEFEYVKAQKQVKIIILNQLKQLNNTKLALIKAKIKSKHHKNKIRPQKS